MEEIGINTIVVRALMALRGMSANTLAEVLQVRPSDMTRWLENDEPTVPVHRQLEALSMLGVRGDSLRPDVVHYWRVTEPIFGSGARVYSALHILTEAFGKAQVVYLARDSDPSFSTDSKAHFGLKFPGFYAILEVRGFPLVNLKFSPEVSSGLAWMEGSVGILMDSSKHAALEPGALEPRDFGAQIETVQTSLKWEKLTELAKTAEVTPDQLAAVVKKLASNQLGFSGASQPPERAAQAAVAEAAPAPAPVAPVAQAARTGSFSFVS